MGKSQQALPGYAAPPLNMAEHRTGTEHTLKDR